MRTSPLTQHLTEKANADDVVGFPDYTSPSTFTGGSTLTLAENVYIKAYVSTTTSVNYGISINGYDVMVRDDISGTSVPHHIFMFFGYAKKGDVITGNMNATLYPLR